MQKILVTGSEGFVGKNLIQKLSSMRIDFVTLDLLQSSRQNHLCMDLSDPKLEKRLDELQPSAVVHLAAQTDVRISMGDPTCDLMSNGFGTLNLVIGSIKAGCSNFVYINSGGAIYSADEIMPLTENSKVKPDSPYGITKQLAEDYVRIFCNSAGVNWKSLALSNVYGPIAQNKKGIFFEVWKAFNESRNFKIYGESVTRDYIHVQDVVDAILVALESTKTGRFNIGTGIETTNLKVYNMMSEKMHTNSTYDVSDSRPGEVLRSALDISKANHELNWSPKISLKQGIENILVGLKQVESH